MDHDDLPDTGTDAEIALHVTRNRLALVNTLLGEGATKDASVALRAALELLPSTEALLTGGEGGGDGGPESLVLLHLVEQHLGMGAAPERGVVEVTFTREGVLGLLWEADGDYAPICLERITPGSQASDPQYAEKGLREGLVLSAVQGRSAAGVHFKEAMEMLRGAGRPLTMRCRAPHDSDDREILLQSTKSRLLLAHKLCGDGAIADGAIALAAALNPPGSVGGRGGVAAANGAGTRTGAGAAVAEAQAAQVARMERLDSPGPEPPEGDGGGAGAKEAAVAGRVQRLQAWAELVASNGGVVEWTPPGSTTGFRETFSQADVPAVMCPVIPSGPEVGTTGFRETFSQADVPAVMCPVIPSAPEVGELRAFLRACPDHDFRRSYHALPGGGAAQALEDQATAATLQQRRLWSRAELRALLWTTLARGDHRGKPMAAQEQPDVRAGVDWMTEQLVVAQLRAAVRELLVHGDEPPGHAGTGTSSPHSCSSSGGGGGGGGGGRGAFDCASVPDGLFWRKNSAVDWSHQCLPGRFGWLSDSASLRDLLRRLCDDDGPAAGAAAFCATMGFARVEGLPNDGYGPVFVMFYSESQLQWLAKRESIVLFRPTWPAVTAQLRSQFDRRLADGSLAEKLPPMWSQESAQWVAAMDQFEADVQTVEAEGPAGRLRFLKQALTEVKPLWDRWGAPGQEPPARVPLNPAEHAVAACRQLLERWYGANEMFMGDGFAWSAQRVRGHAEWLAGSFENLDCARVSLFPGQQPPPQ